MESPFMPRSFAVAMSARRPSIFALVVALLLVAPIPSKSREEPCGGNDFCFSLDVSGKNRSFGSDFAAYGDAELGRSTVRVTRPGGSSSGWIAYRKPIRFFGTNPGFSSSFSFSVSPEDDSGLAFALSPRGVPLEPVEEKWLGLSTSLVSVKIVGSLIEIDVGGEIVTKSSNLSNLGSALSSGEKLRSWIEYNGESKTIQVRLAGDRDSRPMNSTIAYSIDFSNMLWREALVVGLGSWSSNSTEASSIYSWNFTVKHGAPYLMHSEPLNPNSFVVRPTESSPIHERRAYPWGFLTAIAVAAACGAMLTFFMMFVWLSLASRRPVAPVEFPALALSVAYGKIDSVGEKSLEDGKK